MKSLSIFSLLVFILFSISSQSLSAQNNTGKTPQQIRQANYDGLISELNNLAATAISHYKKSAELGGGGKSFSGWVIPADVDTTQNGTFTAKVAKEEITIVGFGNVIGNDGKKKIRVTMIVGPEKIKV